MGTSIEEVYDEIGGMGTFQIMAILLIALCQVPVGWSMLQMSFAGIIPDFHCIVSAFNFDQNISMYNKSTIYYNLPDILDNRMYSLNDTLNVCSLNSTSCDKFSFDTASRTVVTEWGLVCNLKWIKKIIISIQMAGVLLGAILAGQFSDVVGRKKSLYVFALFHAINNIIAAYSANWQMFSCLRFLIGISLGAIVVIVSAYQIEFLPMKWRPLVGIIPSFTLGVAIFAGMAALLEDWVSLHISCGVATIIGLIGYFIVPESPRWLASQGRIQESKDVVKSIAKMNRKPISEESLQVIESMQASDECSVKRTHKYTYLDLFKTKHTTKMSFIFFYYWFVMAIVYYGIAFGVASLSGSVYINIFLLGVMEIPVQCSTFFLNNRIGRRKSTFIFLSISLASLFGCLVFHLAASGSVEGIAINVFSQLAKMMIGCAWSCVQVWGTEQFPTVVRNLGCGFSSLGARVGGMLAPFIIDLDETMTLSYSVLCAMLLFGIILVSTVPETKGKCLKDQVNNNVEKGIVNEDNNVSSELVEKTVYGEVGSSTQML